MTPAHPTVRRSRDGGKDRLRAASSRGDDMPCLVAANGDDHATDGAPAGWCNDGGDSAMAARSRGLSFAAVGNVYRRRRGHGKRNATRGTVGLRPCTWKILYLLDRVAKGYLPMP